MKIINLDLTLNTKPKSLVDITFDVSQHVRSSKILNGLCSLYIKHTSASLIIQEMQIQLFKDIDHF